jgi:hypothetical protein
MGRLAQDAVRLVVLYTSGAEPDWPDELDPYTGTFTYFGDNRSPGRELHDTWKRGNPQGHPDLCVSRRPLCGAESRPSGDDP